MLKRVKRKQDGSIDAHEYFERKFGALTFAMTIRSIREGEELSLEQFATRLGVSRSHLGDIEKGRKCVSPERAARWAELLGYSPGQFIRLAIQADLDAAGLILGWRSKRHDGVSFVDDWNDTELWRPRDSKRSANFPATTMNHSKASAGDSDRSGSAAHTARSM